MKTLLIVATAVAALAAAPSYAQDEHSQHHAAPAATTEAGPTHEQCKVVMGKKMDPKPVHEHSREKSGLTMWPNGKPPSKAEMAKMHEQCAAKMKAAEAPAT